MAWIDLDGAVNVRDLGALPCRQRSEHGGSPAAARDDLQDLSPSDVKLLVEDVGVTPWSTCAPPRRWPRRDPGPLTRVESVRHAYLSVLPERGAATDVAAEALAIRRDGARSRYPDDVGRAITSATWKTGRSMWWRRCAASRRRRAPRWCTAPPARTGRAWSSRSRSSAVGVRRDVVVADYTATANAWSRSWTGCAHPGHTPPTSTRRPPTTTCRGPRP